MLSFRFIFMKVHTEDNQRRKFWKILHFFAEPLKRGGGEWLDVERLGI